MKLNLLLAIATTAAFSIPASAGQSSFSEVWNVVSGPLPKNLENRVSLPESKAYVDGKIPQYEMSFVGISLNLARRAFETLKEDVDYYDRLEKFIHQNGVCLAGTWEITQPSAYSGYFAQGKKGLFIGRASAATNPTTRGQYRAFGFAGKLFPTMDPNKEVETANFFTVDDLGGTKANHFLDVALTNEPPPPLVPKTVEDLEFAPLIITTLAAGAKWAMDLKLGFRPVWQVAEAGLPANATAKTPRWIQIRAAQGMNRVDAVDFRNELNVVGYPGRAIDLDILVSDETKDTSAESASKWTRLGRIHLTESTVSYGCDRRLHFPHPKDR